VVIPARLEETKTSSGVRLVSIQQMPVIQTLSVGDGRALDLGKSGTLSAAARPASIMTASANAEP
jgi:hypothetical protein